MRPLLRAPTFLLLLLCACSGTGQVNTSSAGSGSGAGSTGGGSSGGSTGGGLNRDTPLDGLSVPKLHFAVTGDTRPDNYVNSASAVAGVYPTAVATKLFQQMAGRDADFAVFTGDIVYVYNPPDTSSAAAQIDLFIRAWGALDRPLAPALGNHDVYGGTDTVWGQKFGRPAFYSFTVHSQGGDAVFAVLNDTRWESRQAAWLGQQLALPARWHIVVKHHPTDSTDITFNPDILNVMAQHPPTLVVTGHEHAYGHRKSNELVLGEGGAPLSRAARGYGYAMVDELPNGNLQLTIYDSASDAQIDQWQVSP